jgi:hypothetical protein
MSRSKVALCGARYARMAIRIAQKKLKRFDHFQKSGQTLANLNLKIFCYFSEFNRPNLQRLQNYIIEAKPTIYNIVCQGNIRNMQLGTSTVSI